VHFDIINFFFSPTGAEVNCLKDNFKIYIKIDIKTAATCFGAITNQGTHYLSLLQLELM
jgi:hypothetical protein